MLDLTPLEQGLLRRYQRDFPLSSRPFAVLAEEFGVGEDEVLAAVKSLKEKGAITRLGAAVRPNSIGASVLAAMAVAEADIERVANLVNEEAGVNHNYLREHHFNLWFVVTATDGAQLNNTLARLEHSCGTRIMTLPLEQEYRIDLGFPLHAMGESP